MSETLQRLIDALLAFAVEELARRFPNLPVRWLPQFASDLVRIGMEWATDDVQREAEVRALYAKIQSVIEQGEKA